MSMDMEAAGALASAGLVAHEIEGHTPQPSAVHAHAHGEECANCGSTLSGAFCHQCGQSAHVHRSLLHMGEELLHGILHLDGKVLHTLPMLVAYPGRLTRRYIDGQRTRFVSPLALFLFMVFLMFFTASYTSKHGLADAPLEFRQAVTKLEKRAVEARREVKEGEAKLAAASRTGGDASALSAALEESRARLQEAEDALSGLNAVATAGAGDDPALLANGVTNKSSFSITTGIESVDAAFKVAMKNPELTVYKLKNTASKFSFLLVPISLPFLWLMFLWKRGVAMYDHAVFSLYSLSFMSLMFVVIMLLTKLGLEAVTPVILLGAPPLHMYLQLKGTYGLSRGGALWRTAALLVVAGLVFLTYLLLILILTVQ